jgi:hypothetical protein
MRAFEIAAAVFGMVAPGTPAQGQEASSPVDVAVYVTGTGLLSGSLDRAARGAVGGIFARAGVHIAWVDGKPKSGQATAPVVVHVRFVRQSMDVHSAGALAYATPFAGGVKTITVLCDRIRVVAGGPAREQHILVHVLAHELGHVLQGANRHAETGVMKARWTEQDYHAMEKEPLEFTSTDLDLIGQRLSRLRAQAGFPAGEAF